MYEINWEPSIAEQPTELSKDPAVGFTFYEGLFDTSVQTIEGVYEQVTKVGPVEPRQIDFMVQLGSFSKKESAQISFFVQTGLRFLSGSDEGCSRLVGPVNEGYIVFLSLLLAYLFVHPSTIFIDTLGSATSCSNWRYRWGSNRPNLWGLNRWYRRGSNGRNVDSRITNLFLYRWRPSIVIVINPNPFTSC